MARKKRDLLDSVQFVVDGVLLVPGSEKYILSVSDERRAVFSGKQLREMGFDVKRLLDEQYIYPADGNAVIHGA